MYNTATMRRLLKLFLVLCALLAGLYAATPLWLPTLLSRQLPAGWQLEKLQAGYPGLSELKLKFLRVKGELPTATIELAATDIRFSYQGLKTDIGSVSLDVFLQAASNITAGASRLDKLSLPTTELTGKLPELSVEKLRLVLHTGSEPETTAPLVFDFQTFSLLPDAKNNFQLNTLATIAGSQGSLEVQALFAGKDLQDIEQLSLATSRLQAKFSGGAVSLDFELQAKREDEKITITLPRPARFEYQDTNGVIDSLIIANLPELQRSPQPETLLVTDIGAHSRFVLHTGIKPSLIFNGEAKLDLGSASSNIKLQSSDLNIDITDLSDPGSAAVNGNILVHWSETALVTYSIEDDISGTSTILADEMDIQAQLTLGDGTLMSTGAGRFTGAQIQSPYTSTTGLEISWHELDLLKMTGDLSTNTRGFNTDFEGEIWSGFDFSSSYSLLGNDDIKGSGSVVFDDGPELPYTFNGNMQSKHWNITLPDTTISLTGLESILRAAHYPLPESVQLTDGYIDIRSEIVVGDEITARMTITGHELAASMLETHVRDAGFGFNAHYGDTISVNGPVFISALTLAGDIDVSNIHTDLNIESPGSFVLKNLHAELFDGQLSLTRLQIEDSKIEDTTIEMLHINLGRLLAYADIDGLQGTGKLDISLPAGSDQTGIYVKSGTFSSNGPGHLAYTKEGVAGSNIGLQALENFQYEDLSGTIDYQSDGTYKVAIRLQGKNPDLYGGHPIVFNLNINGLLPALFESLFITGDFEESILKQIRAE